MADNFSPIMSKKNRPGVSSRCSAAHVEPLESRQLLSAAYNAVNLSRLVPDYAQRSLEGIQITNSGLIALDNWMIASNSVQGFIYSLSGHHLYSAPSGYLLLAINDAGDAVRKPHVAPGGPVIDFQGQSQEVPLLATEDESQGFRPSSMNSAGDVAGILDDSYHPTTPGASVDLTTALVVTATGQHITTQGGGSGAGPMAPPHLNDAGTLVFDAYDGNYGHHAAVYHADTQTVTDVGAMFRRGTVTLGSGINASGLVVGTYNRGRSVTGFFTLDTATDTLHTFPLAAGESPESAAVSDNGTIVGTVDYTDRVRNHARFRSKAVVVTQAGQTEDLNTLTTLPAGARLTAARSVNDSGDILVDCTITDGYEAAFLLTPNA